MQFPRVLTALFSPAAGRAERPLRWLLAASIVLPIAMLAIGSALSYRNHMADGRDRLQRDAGRLYEHGVKVFETFELSARYLDEMLANVSDDQIRAAESDYHRRLKS